MHACWNTPGGTACFARAGPGNTTDVTTTLHHPSETISRWSDALHVEFHPGDEVCVLQLHGSLRASTVHLTQGLIDQISSTRCRSVIVDTSLLWEIDDVGVKILVNMQKYVESRHGKLIVYAAGGDVAQALDQSQLRQ
jgi:anti-anti-sigma factor